MSFSDNIKKPLLLTTAAFLATCPIFLAEQAQAQQVTYGSSLRTELLKAQKSTASLTQNLPTKSLGQSQSALDTSFKGLKDTLARLSQQINSLNTNNPIDLPTQKALLIQLQALNVELDRITQIQANLVTAQDALANATAQLETATSNLATAQSTLSSKETALNQAKTDHTTAQEAYDKAVAARDKAEAAAKTAEQKYDDALAAVATAQTVLTSSQSAANTAAQELQRATNQLETSERILNSARQALEQAQSDYDTNLIPDPDYQVPTQLVAHTVLVPHTTTVQHTQLVPHTQTVQHVTYVPHTTTTTVPAGLTAESYNRLGYNNAPPLPTADETPVSIENVSDINFQWGGGQVLNSGLYEDVLVKFTGYISAPTTGDYQFYAPGDDGVIVEINGTRIISDWYDKGGGGSVSAPITLTAGQPVPITVYYYENGGGANVWLYTYQPATGFQLVPTSWFGSQTITETTYEEVITYEEVTTYEEVITYEDITTYTEEIYYTVEPITEQGIIEVDIPEGQERTFNQEGILSYDLKYVAYDDPKCFAPVSVTLDQPVNSLTLSANNGVYGDPCPGWYKHLVGTITYSAIPSAPLIHDPALLLILQDAQREYADALANYSADLDAYQIALENNNSAQSNKATASDNYTAAVTTSNEASSEKVAAEQDLNIKQDNLTTTSNELSLKVAALNTAQTEYSAAEQTKDTAETTQQTATQSVTSAQSTYDSTVSSYSSSLKETTAKASSLSNSVEAFTPTPVPPPPTPSEPEQPTQEGLPETISSNTLTQIDFESADPSQLSDEQVAALQEAALETFLTAEEGSAEYEAALDALYLAAEADDIVLSPELAAIPGAQAIADVINLLGNVGADMNPAKRKDAQEVVVTTVVVGQIAQAAAASTLSNRRK